MKEINKRRVITITIIWFFVGAFQAFYDYSFVQSGLKADSILDYSLMGMLISNSLAGLGGGFVGSMILVLVDQKYRTHPYYVSVGIILFFFILITGSISILLSGIYASLENDLFSQEWKHHLITLLWNTIHLKNIMFWAVVVAITYFFLQMSNKFGPGVLYKILIGKYNIPKTEKRVFMFLDLKSSTTIAENLSTNKYHEFLKDLFSDITSPILNSGGEIYQYIGDEVVISWPIESNRKYNRCIECYFDIHEKINSLSDKYLNRYGIIPEFKAGAHFGNVVAGEVGIIKRDITYSGDILNTTSRIQNECKSLNQQFLISKDLHDIIFENHNWKYSSMGNFSLRGKSNLLELFSVKQAVN